ncbi:hypothetical protein BSKO_07152 [Bryopsis sp. KO-2023]|nr:hypothetical protein BSKO_07152 [Bryopsis sp. KO-2023]
MLQQEPRDIRRALARVFAKGSERQFRDALAENSSDVQWLLTTVKTGPKHHSEEAIKSLAFWASAKPVGTLTIIVQEKALPDIIRPLRGEVNATTKAHILEIINAFAETTGYSEEAVGAGVVPLLVKLMGGDVAAIKQSAGAIVLRLLEQSACAMEGFILGDGLEHVVDWSMAGSRAMKRLGIDVLLVVSHSHTEVRALMAGEGCVQAMLATLQHGPRDCITPALNVLSNLSQIQGIRALMAGTTATAALLGFLSDRDDATVRHAIGALANLSVVPKVRRMMKRLNAVPMLVNLLDSDDVVTVNMAACCLANLAIESDGQVLICEAGAVPKLADILVVGNKHMALLALGNLARASTSCELIAEACGAKPIVDMLWEASDAGREEAVRALVNLCVHEPIREECMELEVPDRLVELFSDTSPDTRRLAVLCLTVIAERSEACFSIFTEKAMIGVIGVLEDSNSRCRDQAALTLSWVHKVIPEARPVAIKHGIVDKLISLIIQDDGTGVSIASSHAAACLYYISEDHPDAIEKAASSGILTKLIEMAPKIEQIKVKRRVASLIGKLSALPGQNKVITASGSMPRLIDMLTEEDEACREAALVSLAACAVDHEMVDSIVEGSKKAEMMEAKEGSSDEEIGTMGTSAWRTNSIIMPKAPADVNDTGKRRQMELRALQDWFNKRSADQPLLDSEIRVMSIIPDRLLSALANELGGTNGFCS